MKLTPLGIDRTFSPQEDGFTSLISWPTDLYLSTFVNGVYFTNTFTPPGNPTQPIWTAVNGGLPTTDVRQFELDPFDKENKQYCILDASNDTYKRPGTGNWTSLLTQVQTRTLTGDPTVVNGWVIHDKTLVNRVWVVAFSLNAAFNAIVYFMYSDDEIAWNFISLNLNNLTPFLAVRNVGWFEARNQEIIFSAGNGSAEFMFYTANFGTNWIVSTTLGSSVWNSYVEKSPNTFFYSNANGNNGPDLVRFDNLLNQTVLQNPSDIGHQRPQAIWYSQGANTDFMRVLKNGTLYESTDAFATIASSNAINPTQFNDFVAPVADNENWLIVSRVDTNVNPHAIYAVDIGSTFNASTKAGTDPVTPDANSIPQFSDLSINSIGIVK